MNEAKPFVKWAGGKRQLLNELTKGLPVFKEYYEPFVGGGALFFRLYSLGLIRTAYLNDFNTELIDTYSVIRNNLNELIEELSSGKYANDKDTYYTIRSETPSDKIKQTARLVYLNKTAFNGLYRVNSKGGFNVPYGKYENPQILDKRNLRLVNKSLKKVEFTVGDFELAVKDAQKGDFVYFDPPYHPLSETSKFTSYTKKDFSNEDQIRLSKLFKKLDERGCFVMLSNSYAEFTAELYNGFNQEVVYASRAINCKATGRGKIRELIIRNWKTKLLNQFDD